MVRAQKYFWSISLRLHDHVCTPLLSLLTVHQLHVSASILRGNERSGLEERRYGLGRPPLGDNEKDWAHCTCVCQCAEATVWDMAESVDKNESIQNISIRYLVLCVRERFLSHWHFTATLSHEHLSCTQFSLMVICACFYFH